jgi:predicted kinase
LWLTAAGDKLAARVAARRHDASDATPEFVAQQLTWDTGALSSAWARLDASAGPDETLLRAKMMLGLDPAGRNRQMSNREAP